MCLYQVCDQYHFPSEGKGFKVFIKNKFFWQKQFKFRSPIMWDNYKPNVWQDYSYQGVNSGFYLFVNQNDAIDLKTSCLLGDYGNYLVDKDVVVMKIEYKGILRVGKYSPLNKDYTIVTPQMKILC